MKILLCSEGLMIPEALSAILVNHIPGSDIIFHNSWFKLQSSILNEDWDYILLNDIAFKDCNAIELVTEIKNIDTSYVNFVIMIVPNLNPFYLKTLVDLGIKYIIKNDESLERLVSVINNVKYGNIFYSETIVQSLEYLNLPKGKKLLSPRLIPKRYVPILNELKGGLTTKQIAHKLNLSVNTINSYKKELLRLTNCSNSVQLITYLKENHLIK
jgi:DNA-binding NarL/FixJ family response regulator